MDFSQALGGLHRAGNIGSENIEISLELSDMGRCHPWYQQVSDAAVKVEGALVLASPFELCPKSVVIGNMK